MSVSLLIHKGLFGQSYCIFLVFRGLKMLEQLWKRYKYEKDNSAREKLIIKCLPLIKSLAQKLVIYTSPSCDVDDLESAGIFGLLDAIERYDPTAQTSFRTYAKCRIRGAMLDEIRNMRWAPRSVQEKIKVLKVVNAKLEQTLSRAPTEEELASAMDMDIEQFRKMMIQIGPSAILISSAKASGEDDEDEYTFLEKSLQDTSSESPISSVISKEITETIASAIRSLPEKEAIVISLYYFDDLTMKEIGEVLSITESRVCQIHAKALLDLFQILNSRLNPEDVDLCKRESL